MAKTYGGDHKWTKGRSRVVRVTDQNRLLQGIRDSAKIALAKLPWPARKKRSWEK